MESKSIIVFNIQSSFDLATSQSLFACMYSRLLINYPKSRCKYSENFLIITIFATKFKRIIMDYK